VGASRPKSSFRFSGRWALIDFVVVEFVRVSVVVEFRTMRRVEFWVSNAVLR